MPETSRSDEAVPAAPFIPYAGFRAVFALVNAALWFVLVYVISTPVRLGMVAAHRTSMTALVLAAVAVTLLSALFGVPGALGGFLEQARSGRIKLPPVETWGPGTLEHIWMHALVRGLVAAVIVGVVARFALDHVAIPDARISLALAALAAITAFAQSIFLSRPLALGDLRRAGAVGPLPTNDYFFRRFAVPQGAGNGLTTALIAAATFPASGEMDLAGVVADAAGTGTIVFVAMLISAGGLALVDHHFGRVAMLPGALTPSVEKRLGTLVIVVAGCAGGASTLVALLGGTISFWPFLVWKGLLGAGTGGLGAALAARWKLTKPRRF